MKRYLMTASAVFAAAAISPSALASVSLSCPQVSGFGYCTFQEANGTGGFGNSFQIGQSFTDTFTLTLTQVYELSITATNTAALGGPINFSVSQLVDGLLNTVGPINFGAVPNDFLLGPGTYTLQFSGTASASASYGGTIDVSPVPEPASWGLMTLGMGMLGAAMRRRARIAHTSFA